MLAAVERLSGGDVDLDALPDTGSLREDMVAMILPQSEEEQRPRPCLLHRDPPVPLDHWPPRRRPKHGFRSIAAGGTT